jgi:signal-transduction protein with cAMP-binding, CBS, and nucleotidyltransferase domain
MTSLSPEQDAAEAMTLLARRDVNQLPVLDGDRLVGLLRREDVLKWLSIHQDGGIHGGRAQPAI